MTPSRLERRIANLEVTVERQAEQIASLDIADNGGGISRRTFLQGIGVAGLGSYAAGSASADPQGNLGTASDPVRILYAERMAGGLTDSTPIKSFVGPGLFVDQEMLRAVVTGATNLGDAEGVFAALEDGTLGFRSLEAGTNVSIDQREDELVIEADDSTKNNDGTNLGNGTGLYAGKSASTLEFRSLVGGTNVTLSSADGEVTIDTSGAGEANTASNVGTGKGWFKQKSGTDLEFRTVTTQGALSATENADTVAIGGPWEDADADNLLEPRSGTGYTGIDLSGVGGAQVVTPWVGTTTATTFEIYVNDSLAASIGTEGTDLNGNTSGGNILLGQYSQVGDGAVGVSITGGGSPASSNENVAYDDYATIGGGSGNQAGTNDATDNDIFATVSGGFDNTASGQDSAIGGGAKNTTSAYRSTVAGGANNTAGARGAAVGGGEQNNADNQHAAVGGGNYNKAQAPFATIAGGGPSNTATPTSTNNVVYDEYGTIGGGGNNQAGTSDGDTTNAGFSTVGGGYLNAASATDATVAGGSENTASSFRSSVGGGFNNTASNEYAAVPGGRDNTAGGLYSFAAGRKASASNHGTFVWGDGTATSVSSAAVDQTVVQANGGMYVGDDGGPSGDFYANNKLINTSSGGYLSTGGTWTDSSSRAVKEDIEPVDGPRVLEQVESLPVSEWSYENEAENVRHVGPMAEDFYETFGLGVDDEHLASLDTAGVALAAIKGLSQKLEERDERIDELETELERKDERIDRLASRLDELESAVEGSD